MTDPALSKVIQEFQNLPPEALAAAKEQFKRLLADKKSKSAWMDYYPDEGPLRRELYPKHLEFFAAGKTYQERALISANRVGKTTCAGYELTMHMTGLYPEWWPGRRFERPVGAWPCGKDAKQFRESAQVILFGPAGAFGTGMLPGDLIVNSTSRSGVPGSIDTFMVKHISGGISQGAVKGYDQGRESVQGSKMDIIWCDEEPDLPFYVECLTRTMATKPGEPNGLVMCTMTPLLGLSDVVQRFLPGGKPPTDQVL